MDAIAVIQTFLDDPRPVNYHPALSLYLSQGRSAQLMRVLAKGPSNYNTQKLASELKKLLPTLTGKIAHVFPITPPPEPQVRSQPSSVATPTAVQNPEGIPEVVRAYQSERTSLFSQASRLHASLMEIHRESARELVIDKLMRLWDRIDQLWAVEDYYQAHGQVIDTDRPSLDKAALKNRQLNLRSYVSRTTKELASSKLEAEKRAKLETRLEAFKRELEEVNAALEGGSIQSQ